MINVPNKIFKRDIDDVEIGMSEIHLYSKDEIEDGQLGYRIDNKGNEIKEWIGDNYIVIGDDSALGDPIIVDINDDKLPVFNMFHDDWSSLQKIAYDFNQYIDILDKIDGSDLSDEEEKDKLITEIVKIVPKDGQDYWESLLQVAYEFLNDLD